jgi:hypothetical protein
VRSMPLTRILCLGALLAAAPAFAQTPGAPTGSPAAPAASASATPADTATTPSAAGPSAAQQSATEPPVAQPPAAAQQPAVQPPAPSIAIAIEAPHAVDPVKARYNVQVMEGVLERAVRYAASQMNRRLQAVSPDLLQLSGAARARGFRLPGYGVFFDVDVPAALRHTMGWTLRLMQQSDQNVQRALGALKQSVAEMDPKQRAQADGALKLLETRFQPPPRSRALVPQDPSSAADAPVASTAAGTVNATSSGATYTPASGGGVTAVNTNTPMPSPAEAAAPPLSAEDLAWAQNPDLAYEVEVRDSLVSAMLEYGSTLALGADEYLTVAARDSENVVMPGDLSETVTVLLRIKGSDLFEYRSGRLSEADARRRIEVREF